MRQVGEGKLDCARQHQRRIPGGVPGWHSERLAARLFLRLRLRHTRGHGRFLRGFDLGLRRLHGAATTATAERCPDQGSCHDQVRDAPLHSFAPGRRMPNPLNPSELAWASNLPCGLGLRSAASLRSRQLSMESVFRVLLSWMPANCWNTNQSGGNGPLSNGHPEPAGLTPRTEPSPKQNWTVPG